MTTISQPVTVSAVGSQLTNFKVIVTLPPAVIQPVSLGVKPHLGPKTKFLSESCSFVTVGTFYDERMGLSFTVVTVLAF
jgi:hypothetical protein